MVTFPDPSDTSALDYDQGADGMPDRTRRAFQSHYDVQLEPSGRIEQTLGEIERVYAAAPDAVVSVSGGKDSMVTLALADASDADHGALHFDWGRRFVPRDLARSLVENIREFASDDRLYVASYERAHFEPFDENDHFQRNLRADPGGDAYEGVGKLAGALAHCDDVERQIVGLRADESGSRERKLESEGLYGESLGQPAAFPIREWSARDVWAYIVANEVPYPAHYDRVAHTRGDGSPAEYEQARFTTVFDPEFENQAGAADGLAHWRNRDLEYNE